MNHDLALAEIARQLSAMAGEWTVADGQVHGPAETGVLIGQRHRVDSRHHLDIGFVIDSDQVVWDCVTGIGDSDDEALVRAVTTWVETTAATIIEMFTQRQQFATSFGPDEPQGLPGHHVIVGPILAFGLGKPARLQGWAAKNLLPSTMADTLAPELAPGLNGIKVFFGGERGEEVAEVRVNEVVSDPASAALMARDWPRLRKSAYVRFFMLAHKV